MTARQAAARVRADHDVIALTRSGLTGETGTRREFPRSLIARER
jgi:hypothetical protein